MKLQSFSMRDVKAETYAAPFFVPNESIAIRLLSELVLDKRSTLGKYPQDFSLYRIGEYDTTTAVLTSCQIDMICSATSCLPKPDPRQIEIPGTSQHVEVPA